MFSSKKSMSLIASLVFAFLAALVAFFLSYFKVLQPVEWLGYDRLLRLQADQFNSDTVIVAMDERSLQEYGSLPWPRDVHAQLIEKLTEYQVKAIGYDVLFDKARGDEDTRLIAAVQANKKIVFPVVVEKLDRDGQLIELQPFHRLNAVTSRLGLVHFELSEDNINRGVYLRAGLGEPYWRSFSAEVLDLAIGEQIYNLPFEHLENKNPSYNLQKIEKSQHILVPYKANADFIAQVSFSDVVSGNVPSEFLKDKVVFVGVTATAARNADFLPVPVDRQGQIMPGVEINATLYDGLKNNSYIVEASSWWSGLLGALVSFLVFMKVPFSLPRHSIAYLGIAFVGLLGLSWLSLHQWNFWIPVLTPIIVMTLTFVLWSWSKIVSNMLFFNNTLQRLEEEVDSSFKVSHNKETSQKLTFWRRLGLLKDWSRGSDAVRTQTKGLPFMIGGEQWLLDTSGLTKKDWRLFEHLIKQQNDHKSASVEKGQSVIEQRRRQVEQALNQLNFLRRFIESTMDQMSDGVILADNGGYIFYSNEEAQSYFPQLMADKADDLLGMLEETRLLDGVSWQQVIKQLLLEGGTREVQISTVENRDIKLGLSLLKDSQGYDYVVVNLSDISNIKQEQRRQLEMIDFISHDLRSPMTSILSLINEQRRSRDLSEEEKNNFNQIEKLSRSSLSLAEHFLMLSRAESHIEIQLYPVEILNSIDAAIVQVAPQAKDKNIEIDFDFMAYEDIWLQANDNLLERVITNLLTNAIKYSPRDSKVSISIEQTDEKLLLKVIDQGDGISQEEMDGIFKPFTRMQQHETGNVKGIGLGLRFVRAAMLRFGGQVSVTSEPQQGSQFILEFPSSIVEGAAHID